MENKEQLENSGKLPEKAWYVVNTYSTHEKKVADNLRRRVESFNIGDLISRIVVAEQEVSVLKDGIDTGKKKIKNLYPGYVFVEMIMTDFAWYIVRNTQGVTGFVGSSGKGAKPFPVPREQIEPVLKRMGMIDESMYERYNEGDLVKIIHGPFADSEVTIISINKETGIVEVEANLFGRKNRFEVDFSDIDKM